MLLIFILEDHLNSVSFCLDIFLFLCDLFNNILDWLNFVITFFFWAYLCLKSYFRHSKYCLCKLYLYMNFKILHGQSCIPFLCGYWISWKISPTIYYCIFFWSLSTFLCFMWNLDSFTGCNRELLFKPLDGRFVRTVYDRFILTIPEFLRVEITIFLKGKKFFKVKRHILHFTV